MKDYADYIHFKADDFLTDAAFQEWIRHPRPETSAYWRGLVSTHPHLREAVDQARLLALGFESSWTNFSDTYVEQSYERIYQQLPQRSRFIQRHNWQRIGSFAAAAVVLLVVGIGSFFYWFTERTVKTAYGELQTVPLPDGSVVTLNANSRLQLPSRYQWRSNREVWLEGEAYFAVSKQPQPTGNYRKFIVHTHQVDVAVLGTRFNVYARPQKTHVLLDEGRVMLSELTTRHQIVMQPGQLIEFRGNSQQRQPQTSHRPTSAQIQQLTAWRQHILLFDGAPMAELSQRFDEVYGLELVLKGNAFTEQQFTGELPLNDLPKALRILSETFDRKAVRDGSQIYFVPVD